jgi:flagellar motor switch protein FliG
MSEPRATKGGKTALTGAQKCAVVCLALGAKEAGRILKDLAPDELERVAGEIISMPPIRSEDVSGVLGELTEVARTGKTVSQGGVDFARQLLEETLGTVHAEKVIEKVRGQIAGSGLDLVKRASPEVLAGALRWEHPQTAAAVLSHMEAHQASRILATLEAELATDILYRIARMESIESDVLSLVGTGLSGRVDLSHFQESARGGGPEAAAKLLNLAAGSLQERLLSAIGERDAEVSGRIRSKMFTFEDLLKIDQKGIQRIVREVETKELALALKAASEELKQHIKSGMSERAAEALEEELEMLGPVRAREVEAMHASILERVRTLDQEGEILIQREGDGDDIIT